MSTNKILLYSVVISLIIHLAALSLISLMEWRGKRHPEQVLTIDLSEMFTDSKDKAPPRKAPIPSPPPPSAPVKKTITVPQGKIREATVDLNNREQRYRPYLRDVREKIERSWIYPEEASSRKEQGTTVIRFSLADTGELVDTVIIRSSGVPSLDEATLQAIRTSHFAPIPENFQLSRLNVIATFEYRLLQ
jgi:TonB family protein